MTTNLEFMSNVERREDDIRFAKRDQQGRFPITGSIQVDKLVMTLGKVSRISKIQYSPAPDRQAWVINWLDKQFSEALRIFQSLGLTHSRELAHNHHNIFSHRYKLSRRQRLIHTHHY